MADDEIATAMRAVRSLSSTSTSATASQKYIDIFDGTVFQVSDVLSV